mmetsp:Transcript_17261/g.40193  ORF Transcript_17261/g.40193 Transcript_17261/m.40193 type:complete len:82 (-) Transcript_17261:91-336(-)
MVQASSFICNTILCTVLSPCCKNAVGVARKALMCGPSQNITGSTAHRQADILVDLTELRRPPRPLLPADVIVSFCERIFSR